MFLFISTVFSFKTYGVERLRRTKRQKGDRLMLALSFERTSYDELIQNRKESKGNFE